MKQRLGVYVTATLAALGCSKAESTPPVFGGTGATVAPMEQPVPAAEAAPMAGPCGAAAPTSDTLLLDDFEDGDNKIFKGFRREGWWFASSDNTEGATIIPQGEFRPERLTPDGGAENLFAARLAAAGHRDWGVVWGTGLHYTENGLRCPLNASEFGGIKLRARGPGSIRITFGMPETLGTDGGGICKERCWDTHGKVLFLTEEWQDFWVPWDRVQQEGWGAEARFDPSRLLQVAFVARPKDLPVDLWVDDLAFVGKASAAAALVAPPTEGAAHE